MSYSGIAIPVVGNRSGLVKLSNSMKASHSSSRVKVWGCFVACIGHDCAVFQHMPKKVTLSYYSAHSFCNTMRSGYCGSSMFVLYRTHIIIRYMG